ncbi:MAG: CotH kinase family protein [Crocinitomicaceae bacterium]
MKAMLFLFLILPWIALSQVNLTSSNLPIVKIITPPGQQINDNTRIVCDMGVIDNPSGINLINDPLNNYNGKIAIEIRGSTSQQYPKKSYGFETQTALGANNNVALMGLPIENDWILNGPYPDKTLLRDALTYELSRNMGHYSSRFRFCELLINNQYLGVYLLFERIKRDNDRVDIATLDIDDLAGDSLTGGYIVKIDKLTGESGVTWTSNFSNEVVFQFHDPESDELHPVQINYMQNFISDFENAIQTNPETNYLQWIEPTSFYDFFILQELGRTVDGYRSSSFMYKDKNSGDFQGRLVAGPMWDFNLSYGNADYCDAFETTGWQYNFDQICNFTTQIPFWWKRLLDAPSYRNGLRCRWNELRQGILHTDSLHYWIDSMATYLQDARIRNFQKWPIIGQYVNWNAFVGNTYEEDVDYLKNYISERATWLDNNIPGMCNLGLFQEASINFLRISPNPANDWLAVSSDLIISNVQLLDLNGNVLKTSVNKNAIWVADLPAGIYFLSAVTEHGDQETIRFIKQ